jgi:hypothetical protein
VVLKLAQKLIADERVACRIGHIVWIEGTEAAEERLAFEASTLRLDAAKATG